LKFAVRVVPVVENQVVQQFSPVDGNVLRGEQAHALLKLAKQLVAFASEEHLEAFLDGIGISVGQLSKGTCKRAGKAVLRMQSKQRGDLKEALVAWKFAFGQEGRDEGHHFRCDAV